MIEPHVQTKNFNGEPKIFKTFSHTWQSFPNMTITCDPYDSRLPPPPPPPPIGRGVLAESPPSWAGGTHESTV